MNGMIPVAGDHIGSPLRNTEGGTVKTVPYRDENGVFSRSNTFSLL